MKYVWVVVDDNCNYLYCKFPPETIWHKWTYDLEHYSHEGILRQRGRKYFKLKEIPTDLFVQLL